MERLIENIEIGNKYLENYNEGNTTNDTKYSVNVVEVARASPKSQSSTPKKIKGDNAEVILKNPVQYHELRAQERSCDRKQTEKQKSQMNALYHFFMSMYEMTKKMPPASQHQVKNKVFQAVSNVEADLLNITNASLGTHYSNEYPHLPYSTCQILQAQHNSGNHLPHSSSSANYFSHPCSSNSHLLVSPPLTPTLPNSNSVSADMVNSSTAADNNVIKEEIMEESITILKAENKVSHNVSSLQNVTKSEQVKFEEVCVEENPHLNFEEADALLNLNQRVPEMRPSEQQSAAEVPLRLSGRHFPSRIRDTAKSNRNERSCKLCSRQKDKRGKRFRKRSCYECRHCDVGLCVAPCFENYHTNPTL